MKNTSIKQNYLFNMIYQVLVIILPVITTPYISRVLSPDGVGAYNYSYSIAYVFVLLANLGSSTYAQREIAFCLDDLYKRSKIFYEILIVRVLTSIIVTPIYFCVIFGMPGYRALLSVQYMLIFATAIDISWLFQGLEDFKRTAIRSTGVKILSVILIFCFVKEQSDVVIYTAIMSFSNVLSAVILWFYIRKNIVHVNRADIHPFKHIKPILLLFLPTAAIYVYTSIDKVFLGALTTDAEVGYYSQAEKIVKLVMTVITSLGTVMLPRIASLINQNKIDDVRNAIIKAIHFVLYLGLPMMCGIIAIAPQFVIWFLGLEYSPSINLMRYLSVLIVIIGLSSVTGQSVLVPLKKQGIYTASILSGATLNVISNALLIPKYGAFGAVVGTIVAEFTVGLIQQITVFRGLDIKPSSVYTGSVKNLIASILMLLVLLIISNNFAADMVGVIEMVIIGCIIYFGSLLIMRDTFTLDQFSSLISKFKPNRSR